MNVPNIIGNVTFRKDYKAKKIHFFVLGACLKQWREELIIRSMNTSMSVG